MRSACACGVPGDPNTFLWALGWYPHALLHGLPLWHSNAIFAPRGIDLAAATTTPFVAFAMAPVTWLWGPIASYNVVTIAAPALNSLSAYWLCRHISKARWASLLAGATYGFGSYDIAHLAGHMQLFVAVFPPLIALCVLKRIDGTIGRRWFVVLTALMLIAQILTSTEIFFTMTVLGIVALALGCAFAKRSERHRIVAALPWLALAYAIALAVCAYFLYVELNGPVAGHGGGLVFLTDLRAFLVPEPYIWVGGTLASSLTAHFSSPPVETNAYIGLPLALITIYYLVRHWSERRTKLLAVLLLIVVVWILGPYLTVGDKHVIPLPYDLFARLPGFNQVLQGRIALYLELICAVILAMWLGRAGGRRRLRWAVGVLALIFVLPNFVHIYPANTGKWDSPTFFSTNMYKRYIARGATVMGLRAWGASSWTELWQVEDHFYWNLADGSVYAGVPAGWRNAPFALTLIYNNPTPSNGPLLRKWIVEHRINDVVVGPDSLAKWTPILRAAGLTQRLHVGGIYLYRVPASWRGKISPSAR